MHDAEWDIRLRGAGKTHDLIQWWVQMPNRILVVPDAVSARGIAEFRANEHGMPPATARKRIITFDDMRGGRLLRGRTDVEVGIDNLDAIVERMLPTGVTLRRVTASGLYADETLLAMRDA